MKTRFPEEIISLWTKILDINYSYSTNQIAGFLYFTLYARRNKIRVTFGLTGWSKNGLSGAKGIFVVLSTMATDLVDCLISELLNMLNHSLASLCHCIKIYRTLIYS